MITTRRGFAAQCAALAGAAAWTEPNPAIRKAMQAVKAAIPKAQADPERPVYHFRPPAQWNNDPNGTIFYRGWHHLFYQHNPYEAKWGHMHWGHARSRDLVNWEHLPIALWPSLEKGEEHVFSGGAITGPEGRPVLFYTSIGQRDPEQWLALPTGDDLITWEKHLGNPVVTLKHHGALKVDSWRDPFLFREAGRTFMVTGGNLDPRGGYAAVQLYEAQDRRLSEWKHLGPIFRHPDRSVRNIECPNLFKLSGKWVLLISPHRPVEYFVGDLDLARNRFVPETQGVLDPGDDYASNMSFDDRGQAILWLWARTNTAPEKGWNSAMALPRVLSIGEDGHLRQNPVPALATLRSAETSMANLLLENTSLPLPDKAAGDCLELDLTFQITTARSVGLRVRCSADGKRGTEIAFEPGSGMLAVDNRKGYAARDKKVRLRVFLDKRLMEVYANDGACATLIALAAQPADRGVELFARTGAAAVTSLRAWTMKPASFSLERF